MDDICVTTFKHILQARRDCAKLNGDYRRAMLLQSIEDIFDYVVLGDIENLKEFDYVETIEEMNL